MPKPTSHKKLSKLKSMLKRLPSFSTRLAASTAARTTTTTTTTTSDSHETDTCQSPSGLHRVYVGKSRRQYLITSELAGNPLLQVLLQRDSDGSGSGSGDDGTAVVGCEVVLFEHLLWMLENGEGENVSADELVEFYAC